MNPLRSTAIGRSLPSCLLLALLWCALNGFSWIDLLIGMVLGFAVLGFARAVLPWEIARHTLSLPRALQFAVLLSTDLFRASLLLAWDVLHPRELSHPRIIAYPLTARSEVEITLVACAFSITPGTVSLDLSDDRRVLYVHAMYCPDEAAMIERLRRRTELPLLAVVRGGEEDPCPR